eukprot:CAMPEP_0170550240 /NCGR_PEP_ID=MMETSP0211-20121228/8314_1 /TAXON_ID=311385 /ORGANISM="Pseudokeronopsis sp., Strain OXSARD2" /LENGTH=125 /DNA_ID=CAMNT_0010856679 /DNA_START=494 /DNA_END=871 /DNA_ORIENTATION=+
MKDLYPYLSWNYVFGWANFRSRTGVFSFMRYDPLFQGIEEANREMVLLRNACHVMVHEIGHMFGLKHCIYYECTMNGYNTYEESSRKQRQLCPVCLRKLQSNIKFDVKQRNIAMMNISEQLGFTS